MEKWDVLETESVLKSKVFSYSKTVARSPLSKKTGTFDVLDCPDWVNIVAITSENKLVLVRQYRHGIADITIETPGGCVDPGENPLDAAKRELQEEAGYISSNWSLLGEISPNPAFIKNKCVAFLALDAKHVSDQSLDPFEEIEIDLLDVSKVKEMILEGKINHSLVTTSLFYYFLKEKSLS
jgi:ADP-ribose pyrophosphatase